MTAEESGGDCVSPIGKSSLVAQTIKNLPARQETWVQSLGQEYPLEEGMALFLPGKFSWTECPGEL